MAKLETFLTLVGHYKYLITIILGMLIICVLSDNSFMHLTELSMQKADLEAEISYYKKQTRESSRELRALKLDKNMVEKVARERYFMKKENEDIFVLSGEVE